MTSNAVNLKRKSHSNYHCIIELSWIYFCTYSLSAISATKREILIWPPPPKIPTKNRAAYRWNASVPNIINNQANFKRELFFFSLKLIFQSILLITSIDCLTHQLRNTKKHNYISCANQIDQISNKKVASQCAQR